MALSGVVGAKKEVPHNFLHLPGGQVTHGLWPRRQGGLWEIEAYLRPQNRRRKQKRKSSPAENRPHPKSTRPEMGHANKRTTFCCRQHGVGEG